MTAAMFIPLGKGGSLVAKEVVENVAEHGVIEVSEKVTEGVTDNIGLRKNQDWGKLFEWGRNPDGALAKLKTVSVKDVIRLKEAGVTLDEVTAWRNFYKNAINKLPTQSNLSAKYRMDLMEKLIELWSKK